MQEIKREQYLKRLIDRKGNGSVKIVTGIRRCGKSYLLFTLFKNHLLATGVPEDRIISLALDEKVNAEYRNSDNLYRHIISRIPNDSEPCYVLLDEAQLAITDEELKGNKPIELYSILNELMHKRNVDVYITGSNSKFLSTDVMTEFRGRGDEIRINPLSFSEFMSVYDKNKFEGYEEYSVYGGLPMTLGEKTHEGKAKYLNDLFKNTYKKDVVERYNLKGDVVLDTLVDILSSDIGSLTNPTKLANTFNSNGIKTNDKTIAQYIEHLTDAFIIQKAKRFDIKGKKYIGSPLKYYFTDIGLRNARLNFMQIEPTHAMENIVYNELLVRGFNVAVGVVEHYAKDKNGKNIIVRNEVDFVCNKVSQRYYIQVAYAIPDKEKMAQESASLDRIGDSFKKIIVVHDYTLPWHNEKGYLIINIMDFLLNPDSLEL